MQQLDGLENILQYASLQIELKSDNWKDLNITTWPREECIESTLHKDGYTSFDSNLLLTSPFGTSFSLGVFFFYRTINSLLQVGKQGPIVSQTFPAPLAAARHDTQLGGNDNGEGNATWNTPWPLSS